MIETLMLCRASWWICLSLSVGKYVNSVLGINEVGGVFIEPCQKCHRRALTLHHLTTVLSTVHQH